MTSTFTHTLPVMDLKVPVDKLQIVRGPTCGHWEQLMRNLRPAHVVYLDLQLTLKTNASDAAFKRMLRLHEIRPVYEDAYSFIAMLAGHRLEGKYYVRTRTGSLEQAI